ncbi:MAG TPA: ABC transporter substrate-binding protein [Solirubrobacterales bacterium]|nr:ABC transporter substrate-binding protein [Solirubrobacterales bacterium]
MPTLAGCGGSSGSSSSDASSAEAIDGGVLRVGVPTGPETLDPAQNGDGGMITETFGEALFETNSEGEIVPRLATSYKTSADGLTVTIHLRTDVTFSNGQKMTSKDVVFSIEQAEGGAINSSLYEEISKVSAPSPDTVVLTLKEPMPAITSVLANYSSLIVPDNWAGMSEKEFSLKPMGTGPFEVKSAKQGGTVKLVSNPKYWGQPKPHLDEIVFSPAAEESNLQQLRSGALDVVSSVTPIGAKTGVPANSGIQIEESAAKFVNTFLLNQNFPLFKDPRVRKAINLAIDYKGITATATDGRGQEGASFLPPDQTFRIDTQPPARDVAEAKELIAEAVKDGVKPEFSLNFNSGEAYSRLATQIVQQNLEEVGLTVKLQGVQEASLYEGLFGGDYDAILYGVGATFSDPVGMSNVILGVVSPPAGQDVKALKKVAEEAATELNEEKRAQLYAELQEMMIEEEALLPLNYQPEIVPIAENVTGLEFDGVGNLLLRNVGFTG